MDVLSSIRGLSFGLSDLYQQIAQQGWEVKKVGYDPQRDRIVAKAKASHGEELEAWGPTDRVAVSNLLMNIVHRNGMRTGKLSMWTHMFTDQLKPIAEAYSKAPIYEPKAATAFMELARDSERRMTALQDHLEIIPVYDPEPYTEVEKMCEDVRKRRRLEVSRAGADHPVWSEDQVIAYRAVHDVLGYCASGGDFGWEGENRAFAAHAALLPVEAQKALFAESIGATAYATYFRAYGPQKVALFPEFMDRAQEKENPHSGYRGIHPSQSFAPIPRPHVKPLAAVRGPGDLDPLIVLGSSQKRSQALSDPNEGWSSGVAPLQPNAYLDHGDPLQSQAVLDNAQLIDTEWAHLNQEDPADLARMKQAITNAFRVVLLSPRKDLRWNAIHYQDIAHIPGDESNPTKYWHTLEKNRQEWNVQRHGEGQRYAHMPYFKQWKALENLMYQKNPQAGWPVAQELAEQMLVQWQTQEQNKIMAEDADQPEAKQQDMYQIELKANKRLTDRLQAYIKEHQLGLDFEAAAAPETPYEGPSADKMLKRPYQGPAAEGMFDVPQIDQPDKAKYGAWMGAHLQAIAHISEHVDEIMKAALTDVHERDGTGHHFRATVLSLGISGVGPKVCSFAWLLLQPMTSQLATIDTHMMDVLGHNFEKDMSNRDYFKFERELGAGRDAAGYGHIPLGTFQWGMWDYKRTGPGTHQDHSAMKVLDPTPHESIDWANKAQNLKGDAWLQQGPDWWRATQPARDQVADEWDRNVAPNVPQNQIPFNQGAPPAVYAKTAASALSPWFLHPSTGEHIPGAPGQTLMNHITQTLGMSVPEVWQNIADEHVGKAA